MKNPNRFHLKKPTLLAAFYLFIATSALFGQEKAAESNTSEFYRLSIRDQVELTVYGEPDLSAEQRIDGRGQIRIPLLGTVRIAGMTVRQAEEFIQAAYIDNRLLRQPMVTLRVADYAPKEVAVFGAVVSPGKLAFPIEASSLDIVDVIAAMGGFTGIARSNSVKVTRGGGNGEEFTVDVESMITDKKRKKNATDIKILPGDVIWVPERIF